MLDPEPGAPPVWDVAIADTLYERVFTDPDLEHAPGFVAPHTQLLVPELQVGWNGPWGVGSTCQQKVNRPVFRRPWLRKACKQNSRGEKA